MYHAIRGQLIESSPGRVVVEAGGIEYEILVSELAVKELPASGEVRLLLRQVVTESAHTLYGFVSTLERDMFEHLITVSNVGPRLAIKALSRVPPDQLAGAIAAGDVTTLKRVKGLGGKKAELIVATLRGSMTQLSQAQSASATPVAAETPQGKALLALLRLGYKRTEAEKAIAKAAKDSGADSSVEALIMASLRNL